MLLLNSYQTFTADSPRWRPCWWCHLPMSDIMWSSRGKNIIITKNIRYFLWNRGAWCFFHDTYLTIEVQGIRCTDHLHDSFPLTDVNPHFTAPGCRYYFKINSWWPIVMSSTHGPATSYCDVTIVPTGIYGCMMLRSARVKVIAITCYFLFIIGPPCFNTGHR